MDSDSNENTIVDIGKENPSICIPRVSKEITRHELIDIFNKLQIGNIRSIHIIPSNKNKRHVSKQSQKSSDKSNKSDKPSKCNSNENNFVKVFVHFDYWYNNDKSNMYKELLNDGGNFKIVYNFPHYLKCFKSKFS